MFVCIYQQKWLYFILLMIFNNLDVSYGETDKCENLPVLDHTRPIEDEEPPFTVGTILKFSCRYGYVYSSMRPTAKCIIENNTAVWKITSDCIPVSCNFPGDIPNGRRIGERFTYPNNVTYICNEGYKRKGLATTFCGTDAEWTNPPPQCNPISCPRPKDPANGIVSYSAVTFKSQIIYSCNKGFRLNGPNKRHCQHNQVWSDEEPQCVENICAAPEPIPGGFFRVLKRNNGKYVNSDVVIYYCNNSDVSLTVRCDNGLWSASPPKCNVDQVVTAATTATTGTIKPFRDTSTIKQENECLNIPKLEHGSYTKEKDNSIIYKCEKGYRIKGSGILKCLPSGKWDSNSPTCETGLPIGYILGIVFGIIALIVIIVGVSLYFVKRRKSQSPVKPNKASLNDAVNFEELQKLEKNHRPIPVTVL